MRTSERSTKAIVAAAPSPARRLPWRSPAFWGAVAAVAALHALALDRVRLDWPDDPAPPLAMQVRSLAPAAPVAEPVAPAVPEPVTAPAPVEAAPPAPAAPPRTTTPQVAAAAAPPAASQPVDAPAAEAPAAAPPAATVVEAPPPPEPPPAEPPAAAVPPLATLALPAAASAAAEDQQLAAVTPARRGEPGAARVPAEDPPPHYRVRVPPAATLRYDLQRGLLSGTGELTWRTTADEGYTLTLEGRVAGLRVLEQTSTGRLADEGLAPERFLDQRGRRAAIAANFDRPARQASFSAGQPPVNLYRGVQDRLSWMVQLAAVLAGNPPLAEPGAEIAMQVVGARGDASVWAFRVLGRERLRGPGGEALEALHLKREPRAAHDTVVDVWVDPRHDWLPVRARMQQQDDSDAFELRLRDRAAP